MAGGEKRPAQGSPQPKPENSEAESKRKVRRWDTDAYADRCIKEKLSGYDQAEIKTARGKTSGLSVKEFIKRHHRDKNRR